MPLDPQARMVLDAIAMLNLPDITTLPIPDGRKMSAARRESMPPGPATRTRDVVVPSPSGDISLRVYRAGEGDSPLPALIWIHGGGFVIGSVDESDADCRMLANDIGCVVVSVEYRLAPEAPFPSGLEDCYAAAAWVAEHAAELGIDRTRIAIGGDSAGGNLSAAVCLAARDRGGPSLAYQLLVYPVTDIADFDTPSYIENAEGYYLTRKAMIWFCNHYVTNEEDRRSGYASVLRAKDLRGLPPAFVLTAECDPLRDEGEAYAARLREAGNAVLLKRYPGMIHGFFSMHPYFDQGKQAVRDITAALRTALALG